MKRTLLCASALMLSAVSAHSADSNILGGFRIIDDDVSKFGYLQYTIDPGGSTADGVFYRFDLEGSDFSFTGATPVEGDYKTVRLLAGYSFSQGATTISPYAGINYMVQETDVTAPSAPEVDEAGFTVGVEVASYVGDKGYIGGVAQYDSPNEANFLRAFGTYEVFDGISVGPDLSYVDADGFTRGTVGLRASYVTDSGTFSLIAGTADTDPIDGASYDDCFAEIQFQIPF